MESHQTISMIASLASVSSLLFSATDYPEGALHLVPLLSLTLPGIDANDAMKTVQTLSFHTTVFSLVPFVDCSDIDSSMLPEVEAEIYHRKWLCMFFKSMIM
jgi:hypothetical protein